MHKIRVLIHGRVQGVGYRSWTRRTAQELGLNGWVRNLAGGSVEAVFAGEKEKVDYMLEKCKRGPFAAKVQRMEFYEHSADLKEGFVQLPTG